MNFYFRKHHYTDCNDVKHYGDVVEYDRCSISWPINNLWGYNSLVYELIYSFKDFNGSLIDEKHTSLIAEILRKGKKCLYIKGSKYYDGVYDLDKPFPSYIDTAVDYLANVMKCYVKCTDRFSKLLSEVENNLLCESVLKFSNVKHFNSFLKVATGDGCLYSLPRNAETKRAKWQHSGETYTEKDASRHFEDSKELDVSVCDYNLTGGEVFVDHKRRGEINSEFTFATVYGFNGELWSDRILKIEEPYSDKEKKV